MKTRAGIRGSDVTTFAIGGELSRLYEPNSIDEIREILTESKQGAKILGAGSNLLIPDQGVDSPVVRLGKGFRHSKIIDQGSASVLIEVGGAMPLMTLSRSMSELGLSGLEFAGGIPASIGGAVWMNAGAHGSEMSQIIRSVSVVLGDGNVRRFRRDEIKFAYRHSGLPASAVIIGAELLLKRGDPEKIQAHRAECLAERKKRQPLTLPSAGSIFRNPRPELTAGMVLEKAGCKGLRVGGAEVSQLHANWIVNPKREATAKDVLELMELCKSRAKSSDCVDLVSELVTW